MSFLSFLSLSLREHVRGKVLWWRCVCEVCSQQTWGTVCECTAVTDLCRKVGRRQSLFLCVFVLGRDRSLPVVAVCVYLSRSLQGSLVCCLTCEWVPGTATISKWWRVCVCECVCWSLLKYQVVLWMCILCTLRLSTQKPSAQEFSVCIHILVRFNRWS